MNFKTTFRVFLRVNGFPIKYFIAVTAVHFIFASIALAQTWPSELSWGDVFKTSQSRAPQLDHQKSFQAAYQYARENKLWFFRYDEKLFHAFSPDELEKLAQNVALSEFDIIPSAYRSWLIERAKSRVEKSTLISHAIELGPGVYADVSRPQSFLYYNLVRLNSWIKKGAGNQRDFSPFQKIQWTYSPDTVTGEIKAQKDKILVITYGSGPVDFSSIEQTSDKAAAEQERLRALGNRLANKQGKGPEDFGEVFQSSSIPPSLLDFQLNIIRQTKQQAKGDERFFRGHFDRYNAFKSQSSIGSKSDNNFINAVHGFRTYLVWELLRKRYLALLNFGVCSNALTNTKTTSGCIPRDRYQVPQKVKELFHNGNVLEENTLITDLIHRLDYAESAFEPARFLELFRDLAEPVQLLALYDIRIQFLSSFLRNDTKYLKAFQKQSRNFEHDIPYAAGAGNSQTQAEVIYLDRLEQLRQEVEILSMLESYQAARAAVLQQMPVLGALVNVSSSSGDQFRNIAFYRYYYMVLSETIGLTPLNELKEKLINKHMHVVNAFDSDMRVLEDLSKDPEFEKLRHLFEHDKGPNLSYLIGDLVEKISAPFTKLLATRDEDESLFTKIFNQKHNFFIRSNKPSGVRSYGSHIIAIFRQITLSHLDESGKALERISSFARFSPEVPNIISIPKGVPEVMQLAVSSDQSLEEAQEFWEQFNFEIEWESAAKRMEQYLAEIDRAIDGTAAKGINTIETVLTFSGAGLIAKGLITGGLRMALPRFALHFSKRASRVSIAMAQQAGKKYSGTLLARHLMYKALGHTPNIFTEAFTLGGFLLSLPYASEYLRSKRVADFWMSAYKLNHPNTTRAKADYYVEISSEKFTNMLDALAWSFGGVYVVNIVKTVLLKGIQVVGHAGKMASQLFVKGKEYSRLNKQVLNNIDGPQAPSTTKRILEDAREIFSKTKKFAKEKKHPLTRVYRAAKAFTANSRKLHQLSWGEKAGREFAMQLQMRRIAGPKIWKFFQDNPTFRPIFEAAMIGNASAITLLNTIYKAVIKRSLQILSLRGTLKEVAQPRALAAGFNEALISFLSDYEARGPEDFVKEFDFVLLNALIGFFMVGRLTGEALHFDVFNTKVQGAVRARKSLEQASEYFVICGGYSLIAGGVLEAYQFGRNAISGESIERYDAPSVIERQSLYALSHLGYGLWGFFSSFPRLQIEYHLIAKRGFSRLMQKGFFGRVPVSVRKKSLNDLALFVQKMEANPSGRFMKNFAQTTPGFQQINFNNYSNFLNNQYGTRWLASIFKNIGVQESFFQETGDYLNLMAPINSMLNSEDYAVFLDEYCPSDFWGVNDPSCKGP